MDNVDNFDDIKNNNNDYNDHLLIETDKDCECLY